MLNRRFVLKIFKNNLKETTNEVEDNILVRTPTSGTFISKFISIQGDIKSQEAITIEGRITGNIACEDIVVILPDGIITGEIEAKEVRIDGKVKGSLKAKIVEQSQSATIEGDILADIVILNGSSVGNILCRETLEIGEDANVKSNKCIAETITIDGCITGNVVASKLIELEKNATLKGSIKAKEIKSELGCKISAKVDIFNNKDKNLNKLT